MTPTIHQVQDVVCDALNVSRQDLLSGWRTTPLVWKRQIAMVYSLVFTGKGLSEVGRHFCKDHSTVYHAREVHNDKLSDNLEYRALANLAHFRLMTVFFSPVDKETIRFIPLEHKRGVS